MQGSVNEFRAGRMTFQSAIEGSYAQLPERFFRPVQLQPVRAPRLIRLNEALARDLGLDPAWLASADGVQLLSGSTAPEGVDPIALAYAGHQFGHFVPQLGDGRALLLGEVVDAHGRRRDIQLKGSGRTPFSRNGDGRAALGPVLREYIVSEAMAALGIPTTRTLAAVATGEIVRRDTVLPGAVLTRVAASHIRIGTFQYFAARGDVEGVRLLAEHAIARHYPEAAAAEVPALELLRRVIAAQARLVARWMHAGFIHGVMNTDNMTVSGETIDYGPCAFLDAYDPAAVFSSIDQAGRYAYGNQPAIAQWNLARLAETLLPLISEDEEASVEVATAALKEFGPQFDAALADGFCAKIGVTPRDGDMDLVAGLLAAMHAGRADFTLTFRALSAAEGPAAGVEAARKQFAAPEAFDAWAGDWLRRLAEEPADGEVRARAMGSVNPRFIPRNHRIEAVIAAAVERDDFAPFEELLAVLATPFDDQPAFAGYADPPTPDERVTATFCGT